MIFRLVFENVRHRPVRTLLSILLIAVPVTLILALIGLSNGFLDDSRKRASGVGADIIFKAPGSSLMTFSTAALPQKIVDVLATEPHVVQATGTLVQPIGGFDSINGIDLPAFEKMSGGFTYVEGHAFNGPNDLLVDTWYATQRKVHAGGKIKLFDREWNVAGVVEPGKLAHLFAPLSVLQGLFGEGKVSQVFIKIDKPADSNAVVAALKTKYDGYGIWSLAEMQSLISVDNIPMVRNFINVILGIGVIIGFAVVSLSMYMAVLQRTREIGILKSMGATKAFIMNMILAEAFCLGLGGTILGIILSFAARAVIHAAAPASLPQTIVYSWWPRAGAIAMGAALLGAIYPGMMAVRQDPIEALAHE
ncbi:MAG TPA: FtsX-like permease family protein [Bryobacteraceae bacterium]|nr:FtsX-like permease family protein [Bryobacteraceae bacterium]